MTINSISIIYIGIILCIILYIFKYIHVYVWGYKLIYYSERVISNSLLILLSIKFLIIHSDTTV